jgi:hypothetical protein
MSFLYYNTLAQLAHITFLAQYRPELAAEADALLTCLDQLKADGLDKIAL